MSKPTDKNITMPETFWQKLQELGNSNADGTRGRMLVMLSYLASASPELFGLFPPGPNKSSHPEVDIRSTGEGYGQRVNISMLPRDWETVQALANTNTKGYKSTLLRHLVKTAYAHWDKLNLFPPSDVPIYRTGYTVTQEMKQRMESQNRQLDAKVFGQNGDEQQEEEAQCTK